MSMSSTHSAPTAFVGSDPQRDGSMSISDMARAFNVSQRTLRFYEDRGLLSPQRDGNSRLYGPRERNKLKMILRGKKLGFTLTEISRFISGDGAGGAALALDHDKIAVQISHLERQREGLDAAIRELRATQERLASA
jgi:DNA-binding transcriptional MerR regulator